MTPTYTLNTSVAATRGVLYENDVLRNFAKFTGKHLHQSLLFNKVPVLPFLQNTSRRILISDTKSLKKKGL